MRGPRPTRGNKGPRPGNRRAEYALVLSAVLFVAALTVATALVGADGIIARLRQLGPGTLAGLLALSLANYGARTLRWHAFGRQLGMDVPLGHTALYYLAGFSMTATPGKIGEALRLWLLQRCHGYRYARAAPVFVADRIGDMTAVAALCLAALPSFVNHAGLAFAAAALLGFLVLPVARPAFLQQLVFELYRRVGRAPRFFAGLRAMLRQTRRLFTLRVFALGTGLGVLGWLSESAAFYWLLSELGTAVTFQQAVFIFCFSMLVGAASMIPGGLVGTEATMIGLLVVTRVDTETAVAATAIIRVATLWFAVLIGFVALPPALRQARSAPVPAVRSRQT